MTGRLRHTIASRDQLSKNAAHNFAAKHALVHYRSGAIYSFIPKNACTTLRVSLAVANGCISETDEWNWVHANNDTFSAELRDLACAGYSFVVLRCPFSRLASSFLDKIVGKSPELWHLVRAVELSDDPDEMTFRGFVAHLENRAVRRGNIHWRPQVEFLVYKEYSDWFSVERFGEAAKRIEEKTGMQVVDMRHLSGHGTDGFTLLGDGEFADVPARDIAQMRREGSLPAHRALYDEPLIRQVARQYAEDIHCYIDRFGESGLTFPTQSFGTLT